MPETEVRSNPDLAADNERLREALQTAVNIANEAWAHWDESRDAKLGKLLKALSGHMPKYRQDIDKIHAALEGR